MSARNLFASILMACLMAVGLACLTPVANAAPAGQSFLHLGESARNNVTEIKYRHRHRHHHHHHRPKIFLPIGPSYLYYDYPYYYSRGYYPYSIGPGYAYYGPSGYSDDYSPKYEGRCSHWRRRCVANWGSGNEDYYGCMQYHRCN